MNYEGEIAAMRGRGSNMSNGILACAIVLVHSTFVSSSPAAPATTYVVFRYDDFASDAPGLRQVDKVRQEVWLAEKRIDATFAKYGFPYVVAIIPQPNSRYTAPGLPKTDVSFGDDREKVEFIRAGIKQGRIDIAQHGLSHVNHCLSFLHRGGEFRERGYQPQYDDIIRGRDILLGACGLSEITTFVPPWNAWDSDTARALIQAGFKILSTDRYYYYDSLDGLAVIPKTSILPQFESLVDQGRLSSGGVIIVLYHSFDLVKFQGELGRAYFGVDRLESLVRKVAAAPDLKVVSLQQLRGFGDFGIERYRAANSLWKLRTFWVGLLPIAKLPGYQNEQWYLSGEEYMREAFRWRLLTAALAGAAVLAGVLVRFMIKKVLGRKGTIVADTLAAAVFCLAVFAHIWVVRGGHHIIGVIALPLLFALPFVIASISRILARANLKKQAATV
jgi:hypothetical protein